MTPLKSEEVRFYKYLLDEQFVEELKKFKNIKVKYRVYDDVTAKLVKDVYYLDYLPSSSLCIKCMVI